MKNIIWAYTKFGYTVQLLQNGQIVDEYFGGNHAKESTIVVEPTSPNALPLREIRKMARITAYELGVEHDIPVEQIEYDEDLQTTLNEQVA
jgi:hypothetical protein